MSTGVEAHCSPRRWPIGGRPRDTYGQSPLRSWYADTLDQSRTAISPLSPVQTRSPVTHTCPEGFTPRRTSPVVGTRASHLSGIGPMSPRYAVVARRRYQVMTSDYPVHPQAASTRVATTHARVFSSTLIRCGAAASPARCAVTNTALSTTVPHTMHQSPLHDVVAASHPVSARQQCLQQPQQHKPAEWQQPLRHATAGQKLRGTRRDDDSVVARSEDVPNMDDVIYVPVNTLNQKPRANNGVNGRIVHQMRHTQAEDVSRHASMAAERVPQQVTQRVVTPSANRAPRASLRGSLYASPTMDNSLRGSSQRSDLNITLNRELPIHESLCIPAHRKATSAVTANCMYSSLSSTTVHRCLNGSSASKVLSQPITAPGSTTPGTTPVQSDESSRSSTGTLNLSHRHSRITSFVRDGHFSFVSARPLLQQFVQRWRNHYEENKNAYCEGGYMTVTPGKKLNSRYVVVQKLGWGEFSTVWLTYDTMHKTLGKPHQAFVALKIAKCDNTVSWSTQYEINLLRYIGERASPTVSLTNLVDYFEVPGQYGSHVCMVMPLHGSNLLSIIDQMKAKKRQRSPQEICLIKEVVASILLGLEELDGLDIIHTDIKPENVLCSSPDLKVMDVIETFCRRNKERSSMVPYETVREAIARGDPNHLVYIADFGLSVALKPPTEGAALHESSNSQSLLKSLIGQKREFPVEKSGTVTNLRGTMIQTREYRAPEIIIGLDFNTRTDLWSVGCMVFELITGDFLMDPKRRTKNERMMDVEHLVMMMQLLGPVPEDIIRLRTQRDPKRPPPRYIHRYFNESGRFIYADRYRLYPRRHLDRELEAFLPTDEAKRAADFIMRCLSSYDPVLRPSAHDMFTHEWLSEVMGQRKH
ncbi:putative protein kinase [Trypanosoma rangeli]|uniref:non-specific serine/threonine protein kinase n=1 Tax=Trypanosoma rangeli TaxID=5698 RepID=A0A422NSR4_TRYRA|nr:putative protein kinase [Trypanosoma rangeli]RNF08525.1 putative protein kinase [Trypanosoma rangeli]|eukprot:RNF08525.1 putative protein kinase [Trypanosoma rangeli]